MLSYQWAGNLFFWQRLSEHKNLAIFHPALELVEKDLQSQLTQTEVYSKTRECSELEEQVSPKEGSRQKPRQEEGATTATVCVVGRWGAPPQR